MGIIVVDGTGSSFAARVNSNNQLLALASTRDEGVTLNLGGQSYGICFNTTPTSGTTAFFSLLNGSSTPLHILGMRLQCAAAETVKVLLGNGTLTGTVAGTVTPVALISSNSSSPGVTANYSTAGFTVPPTVGWVDIISVAAGGLDTWRGPSRLVISPGGVMVLQTVTGGAAVFASVTFGFVAA